MLHVLCRLRSQYVEGWRCTWPVQGQSGHHSEGCSTDCDPVCCKYLFHSSLLPYSILLSIVCVLHMAIGTTRWEGQLHAHDIAVLLVLQVYDTITDAMLRSMASVESASGIQPSKQLSRWQHLLAGVYGAADGQS